MTNVPLVHSAELQSALQSTSPKIHSFNETMNRTSADIKALECFLQQTQKRPIAHPFSYAMSCRFEDERLERYEVDCEIDERIVGTYYVESLVWDEGEGDSFRLRFVKTRQENIEKGKDGSASYTGNEGPLEILESRPLIECKAQIRSAAYVHLPMFLEEFAASLPVIPDVQGVVECLAEKLFTN